MSQKYSIVYGQKGKMQRHGRFLKARSRAITVWLFVQWLQYMAKIDAVLHSKFLQPGNGIIKETWYKAPAITLDAYRDVTGYPTCPHSVQNLDDFNDAASYVTSKQKYVLVRFKGYFVPSETGNHRFYAKCKEMCSLRIEANPSDMRKILQISHRTSKHCWECNASQKSREIYLYKRVRYYIEFLRIGNGYYDFAALGVRNPSGTYERPIQKRSLWRTLTLYYWHGLLGEYYDIASGTRPELGSLPTPPTEVRCLGTTSDDVGRYNFGIRATGFFLPPETANYRLYLQCKNRCVFYLRINGTQNKIAEQDDISTFQNMGLLNTEEKYFMKINFYKDNKGGTKFFVKRMKGLTFFDYFKSTETRTISHENEIIPEASYNVINSTSVNITWNAPKIPLYNNFTLQSYKIRFWPLDNPKDLQEIVIINKSIISKVFAGLGIWTIHRAEIWYIGDKYTIKPKDLIFRSGEGAPSAPPSRIYLQLSGSTSIIVRWGAIPFQDQHGVLIGFVIRYSKKNENNWFNVSSNTIVIREKLVTGLKMYTEYDIRVAGKTSAGIGVFSSIFTQRTMEGAPSAAPVNLSAHNLSSRALNVSWGAVPSSQRNGIVRVYVIYYKLKDASAADWSTVKTHSSVNTVVLTSLKHWSFYEIKIAAKTIEEGVKSEAVIARTDEYVPYHSPTNVTGVATGSKSMTISWTEIPYAYTNGIITDYWVSYKETEGYAHWKDRISAKMYVNITGLEEYFNYTIKVAGRTSKGVGVFSSKLYVRTEQDVPSASPSAIKAKNTSANSLLVTWHRIPYRHQSGIIIGYKVSYRENNTSEWKEKFTNDKNLLMNIHDLKNYTWYEIRVAGITITGVGTFNSPILAITDENVPSAPPTNFSGNNATSRSIIIFWDQIPLKNQNGILLGFLVQYKEAVDEATAWMETSFDATSDNGTVHNLKMFQAYYLRIAGMTSKGVGVYSNVIKVWTDEDSPEGYPMNVTGVASSSTAVSLSWDRKKSNDTNGIVLAYRVFYQVVRCPEDQPTWCSESNIMTTRTANDTDQFVLEGLRKFTEYYVWIRVLNKIGTGPPSPKFKIKTSVDIPAAAPQLLESFSRDTSSINLYWDPIKESMRNGIIVKYRIFYKLQDKDVLKSHRVVRAVLSPENITVEGLLPGESYKDVSGSNKTAVLENLEPYRWYIVRIAGMTIMGLGPVAIVNASCGQSVAVKAPQLRVYDTYSFNEISIDWSRVSSFNETRGTVLQYNIRYQSVEFEMSPVVEHKVTSLSVRAPVTSIKLKGLTPFTKYRIEVAAVTQSGIGVYTNAHYGETCRCEKQIQVVKRILLPLITKAKNDTFSSLVDSAIKKCCSSCAGATTRTVWEIDTHGDGVLSPEDIFEELQHGKEVYAPQLQEVHTWWHLDKAHGIGKFIPVMRSAGVAVIAKKLTTMEKANVAARTLVKGLIRAYPVMILSVLILVLLGYFHWFSELKRNRSYFSDSFFDGMHQSIWFSCETQSTVGSVDMVPSSTFWGRIGAMTSMIFGIIWKTLLIASITVTILVQIEEDKRKVFTLTGKRVAVTNQTQLLALKKGASIVKVVHYKDYMTAINKVLDGSSDLALIDGLSIMVDDSIVRNEQLVIKEIIYNNEYYGVVVNGKAERLANCINIQMRSNKYEIEEAMETSFHSFWKMIKSRSKMEEVSYILSNDSTAFKVTITTVTLMLVLAIIYGLLHERKRRRLLFLRVGLTEITNDNRGQDELMKIVEDFVGEINKKAEEIDLKHAKQRVYLSNKRYAVNIVPDIIELFGNADYEDDIKKHKELIGMDHLEARASDQKCK